MKNALAALLGLALTFVLVFVGAACKRDDPDGGAEARRTGGPYASSPADREAPNPSATENGGGSPATSPQEGGAQRATPEKPPSRREKAVDPVAEAVESVLRDVVYHRVGPEDQPALEKRLLQVLEDQKMGTAEARQRAVSFQVKTMLDKQREVPGRPQGATNLQEQAIRALSSEMATDFYRKLPMSGSSRHEGTLLAAAREVEMPAGYERAAWTLLGGFEYRERKPLPAEVTALDGKKVGISGYMITLEEVEDIHEFLLVESLWSCCFGTPPEVHQVILVKVPGQRGADFTTSPILILGKLSVGEEYQDGFVTSLYRMTTDKVQELE